MYKENKEPELATVQIQPYRRPAVSGVGILQSRTGRERKKERPTTGGRDCRDKSSGDPSIPGLLTGHEANAQPTAVV